MQARGEAAGNPPASSSSYAQSQSCPRGPLLTLEFLTSLSGKRPTWASFLPCHFLLPLKALIEAPNHGAPAPCPFAVKLPGCRSDLGRSVWGWLLVVAPVCAPSCSSGWDLDMAYPGPDSTSCPLPLSGEPCQKPTRLPRGWGRGSEEDPRQPQGHVSAQNAPCQLQHSAGDSALPLPSATPLPFIFKATGYSF